MKIVKIIAFLGFSIVLLIACKTPLAPVVKVNAANEQQPMVISQAIDPDPTFKKGVLPNGFTYYLHSTDVVKDKASYYIIQNVGSILENDDQKGLAHFLEHMAFNGTKIYPGKKFLNTMQENGLVFGRDINAYTSFDETVYNINNVPTTPEMTQHGLQILHDWANDLLLTDEEIDAERGVIKEEWRTRQDGRMRVLEQTIDVSYGNSKYGKRLPIGSMEVVENFEYKVLRDFYHDWYRTDLQAIAIVGDIDVASMEAMVIEKFSKIPAVSDPRERFEVSIANNDQMLFATGMDKEVGLERIVFSIRHPKDPSNTGVKKLRNDLETRFFIGILNERLQAIVQQADAPILFSQFGIQSQGRKNTIFNANLVPKPDQQHAGLELIMNELQRAVKFGFTQAELKRQVTAMTSNYENYLKALGDRNHSSLAGLIQQNYLENEPINDPKNEYQVAKKLMNDMTTEDLHQKIKQFYTPQNRAVVLTAVEGKKNLTMQEVTSIIETAENNSELQPYEEENLVQGLIDPASLTAGSIAAVFENEITGHKEFGLSNGITVYFKQTDKDKNSVSFTANSEGGYSLVDDADYFNASLATSLASRSGLAGFNKIQLDRQLTGKSVRVSPSIGEYSENINGGATSNDVETMLQLVHLQFTKPRFEQQALNILKQELKAQLEFSKTSLNASMRDSLQIALYGANHPYKYVLSEDLIERANLEQMQTIYTQRFGNAADFKFFIVGDVDEETIKPLLETYIASLPTNDQMEDYRKAALADWVKPTIDKDIFLSMENPKGNVNIGLKKELPYTLPNRYKTQIFGAILQLRYTESLREQEGGTYGARVRATMKEKPIGVAEVRVNFDCNPEMVDKLTNIVQNEIDLIKKGQVKTEDFDKTVNALIKDRIESKQRSSYDLRQIITLVKDGYNIDDKENFEDIINAISTDDIQKLAQELTSDNQHYQIVFKPKRQY